MIATRYRLSKLSLTNFRGFTTRQRIEVAGRHLFIFGPNAYGKSSIVEAIRWCLFGSPPGQQDIEVRNTFFPLEVSEVVLELTGGLNLQRQLRPGQQHSRPTISDNRGGRLREREVFPQLTRLGQSAGTQVIFAAQQTAGRRLTDIAGFGKVLHFHLGVQDVPDLLDKLRRFKEERRNEQEEMAHQLDEFSQKVRNDLTHLKEKKEEIVLNPPWGSGPISTRTETAKRIGEFFREVARLTGQDASSDLSPHEMLQRASELNEDLSASRNENLGTQLEELERRKEEAEQIQASIEQEEQQLSSLRSNLAEQQLRLSKSLGSDGIDALREELAVLENAETEWARRVEIARLARDFVERFNTPSCPACEQPWDHTDVVGAGVTDDAQDGTPSLDEVRRRMADIEGAQVLVSTFSKDISDHEVQLSNLKAKVTSFHTDLKTQGDMDVPALVRILGKHIAGMKAQISDSTAEQEKRAKGIKDLEAEERFHAYQERVVELERVLSTGLVDVRNALADYDAFFKSADDVARLLLGALDDTIGNSIAELSQSISAVFRELTNHPSYDGVTVQKGEPDAERLEPGSLELRVTTSRRPDETFPTNVLNGQAAKALQLVPYFVFSDFWKDIMELDLLLVDDPSESFDTSHIEHLMNVLKNVASHTQLVLASHEEDRVRPVVERLFASDERCIVRVTDFDPEKGPSLEIA